MNEALLRLEDAVIKKSFRDHQRVIKAAASVQSELNEALVLTHGTISATEVSMSPDLRPHPTPNPSPQP